MVEGPPIRIRDSGYDFSQHPREAHLRNALYLFSYSVTAADVNSCFSGILERKIDPTSQYFSEIEDFIGLRVALPAPPTSLNPRALTHELLQIAQPALWLQLLRKTRKGDSGRAIDAELKAAFPPDSRQGSLLDVAAYQFAIHNLRILGHVLHDMGMAAVYGPEYSKAISEKTKYARDGTIAKRYEAVLEASRTFKAKASSAEEVVDRLRQLFPTNPLPEPTSAFSVLQKKRAFDGPVDRCPAPGLTMWLFDAYGKKLREASYQQRLVASLNSPRRDRNII